MSHPTPNGYPAPGEVIDGKYQIERMLGEGGMGAVARAMHLHLRSSVALKFMNPQFAVIPGAVERFFNEGVAASQIQSEHIVRVFDVCRAPSGAPCLVMECLEGADLSAILQKNGPLPVGRAIHFTLQILRGLQVAHAAGVVHRDMKPSNCFVVSKDGEPDFIKLLDFGISKVVQPGNVSLTRTHSALGTPLYMSPEQAKSPRDVDPRSDLYSVGVILYELLSGITAHTAPSGELTELLYKLFSTEPEPILQKRPDLPPDLARAVHQALARDPDQRFPNALAMAEALAPFAFPKSLQTLEKMRAFVPGDRISNLPSEHGAPLVASLPIQSPPSVIGNKAAANVDFGSAATHFSAPPPTNAPAPASPAVFGVQGPPPGVQPEVHVAGVANASTNMSAARTASTSLPPKSAGALYAAIGVAAVCVIGLAAFAVVHRSSPPSVARPDPTPTPAETHTVYVPVPTPPSAAPSAPPAPSVPSTPTADAGSKSKVVRPQPPPSDFGLGTGIHQ